MGGHVRGTHQALLMTIVVHMHAAAHRAYHGPRGGGERSTHFVILMLPRLVRVLVRADLNTRLLKLESGKHTMIFHDGRAWAAPWGTADTRLGAGLGEVNVTATVDDRRPANAIWLPANYDLMVRAERAGSPARPWHAKDRQI